MGQAMKYLLVLSIALFGLLAQAATTYQLVRSDRDAQRNLICTYQNGENINMGKSDSQCPSAITR